MGNVTISDGDFRLLTIPRWDWTGLADRPSGHVVRRLSCEASSATYLVFDPAILRCVVWLSAVPAGVGSKLRATGYESVARRSGAEIWVAPVDESPLRERPTDSVAA